jgi:hypothetical protein
MYTDYYVYRHRNPVTKETFYIGSGKDYNKTETRATRTYDRTSKWHKVVKEYGSPVIDYLVEGLTRQEARKIEEEITNEYKAIGAPLVNEHSGNKKSEETKVRIGKALVGRNKTKPEGFGSANHKPVIQLTKEGKFIAEYKSQAEASKITGVRTQDISACTNSRQKSAGGFIWRLK